MTSDQLFLLQLSLQTFADFGFSLLPSSFAFISFSFNVSMPKSCIYHLSALHVSLSLSFSYGYAVSLFFITPMFFSSRFISVLQFISLSTASLFKSCNHVHLGIIQIMYFGGCEILQRKPNIWTESSAF